MEVQLKLISFAQEIFLVFMLVCQAFTAKNSPLTRGHMLHCHTLLQVELSEEAKMAWQLEQLHQ